MSSTKIHTRTLGLTKGALQSLILFAASVATAATPVESSISLETYARICSDGTCAVILEEDAPIDSDTQLASLNALSAFVDAAVVSNIGASADATMNMNASFISASSGSMGFLGDVGIRTPAVGSTHACLATNNTSEGFSYTFLSSADGLITIDYSLDCTPTGGTNFCGGQIELYLDGVRIPALNASVSVANPTDAGSVTRQITLGSTHILEIRPRLGSIGGGTGCTTPDGFSWSLTGNASWSFDAAPPAFVSHTFSGRAFADPMLVSGVVPPAAQAFLDAQGLEGAWFAASFSFDDLVADSDPAAESAEYRNAIVDSDLAFGPLEHEATTYCNEAFLDCSIFVENDLSQFGGLFDEYLLRARNHRVIGVPQVLIPGTTVLVDEFNLNASFVMLAGESSLGSAPTLLSSTEIDPDIEGLFGSGAHDVVISYFGIGPEGSYSVGYRVETPFFVPEPEGSVWVMMAFFAWLAIRHSKLATRD